MIYYTTERRNQMNCLTYQKEAHKFASYGGNKMYPALGLCEEAGEVAGKIAKFIRKHDGIEPTTKMKKIDMMIENKFVNADFKEDCIKFRKDIEAELGDVCWMVAELCSVFDIDLEEVMEHNISKLADRKSRGVIVGEGDNR